MQKCLLKLVVTSIDNIDLLQYLDIIDSIERMEKPFDRELSRMSKNQLLVLRAMIGKPEAIMTTRELAKKTGVVEKQLGGVLSSLTRKRLAGRSMLEIMGRDGTAGLRFRLNSKAVTVVLAEKQVKVLIASYK